MKPFPLPNTIDHATRQAEQDERQRVLDAEKRTHDAETLRIANEKAAREAGIFAGNSETAQANRTMLELRPRILDGSATDEQRAAYALAITHHTKAGPPQLIPDPKDPSRQVLASVPGQIPHGFPPPDYKPPAAGGAPALERQGAPVAVPATSRPIDLNESQSNAALYGDRMAAADKVISATASAAADPVQKTLGGVPVVGNYLTKEDFQRAQQAQSDFINALLRKESGAAISSSEFDNGKRQYFPQPGDGPAVLKQKADNRALAITGIQRGAGPGYKPAAAPASPSSPASTTAPARPASVPPGSAYSPSRNQWRGPNGQVYPGGS